MTFDRRFDLSCHGTSAWLGDGRYRRDGDRLTFRFERLARQRELVKPLPDPIRLDFEGHGNSLDMIPEGGDRFRWTREYR